MQDASGMVQLPIAPILWAGAFWQPWLPSAWAPSNFTAELGFMRSVCMTHVIWQWTLDSTPGTMQAWYNTSLPGFSKAPSVTADPVLTLLQAASMNPGFHVWLGLNMNDEWWSNYANNDTWLSAQFELAVDAAKELDALYGASFASGIAGYYLPLEVDNVNYPTNETQGRITAAYAGAVSAIHAATGKRVMAAPFFNAGAGMDSTSYAAWWGAIANASRIDIVALQDGVGAGHATVPEAAAWLGDFSASLAVQAPATALWADLETFAPSTDRGSGGAEDRETGRQTLEDRRALTDRSLRYSPASFSRVVEQLVAEAPAVTGVTTFSFTHYDSPQQGFSQQYDAWRAYATGQGCVPSGP
jgi:hypothetical protein